MSFRDATQNAMYSVSTYLLRLLFQRLIRFCKRPHLVQLIIVPCGLECGSGQSDDEPDKECCQGQDLAALGLNVNFMPIVDVLTSANNPGLPERTSGSDPTLVTNKVLSSVTLSGWVACWLDRYNVNKPNFKEK